MRLNKICTAVFLSILASLFVGQAYAETWSPTGNGNLDDIDGLEVKKGIIQLTCKLTGEVTLDGSNATVDNLVVYGGFLNICNNRVILKNIDPSMGTSFNMEGMASNTVTIESVYAEAPIGGDCSGDLTGTFDQATGILTFINATLPGVSGAADCEFSGELATFPEASYTIP